MTTLPGNVQLTLNISKIRESAPGNSFYRVATLHVDQTRVDLTVEAMSELIAQLQIARERILDIEQAPAEGRS